MPLISIIIPTYNPNKEYFNKCIESILIQSFTDYEILIVVNNAQEETINYINNLSKKDNRIRVIFSKLGGISNARNYGIDNSLGDYILFVDDDDELIDSNYLYLSYSSLNKSYNDFVIFGYTENDIKNVETNHFPILLSSQDIYNSFFCYNKFGFETRSVWAKAFKKDIIIKNNILFDSKIRSGGEDALFILKYSKFSKQASFFNIDVYHHRVYEKSTTYRYNPNSGSEYDYFISQYLIITDKYVSKYRAFFIFCDQIFYNIIITYICHKDNKKNIFKRSHELEKVCNLPYIKIAIKTTHIQSMITFKKKIVLCLLKIHAFIMLTYILDKRYRN